MKRMNLPVILFLTTLFIISNITTVHAQFTPISITTNPDYQTNPSVSGNRIVWQDRRNQSGFIINNDIYMYTLPSGPEQRITTYPKDQSHPEIWQNIIVWDDLRNGNRDIYFYDINTGVEHQVTTNDSYQDYPVVSDSVIVWRDNRNGKSWEYDIYMYDMNNSSETRITPDAHSIQNGPRISGHKVVWEELRGSTSSIFLMDLDSGQERQLTADNYDQYSPDIHGDSVVWIENRNGRYLMYMTDLNTNTLYFITDQVTAHSKPRISDKGIVWNVLVDMYGNDDIYFYEFATEALVPLATSLYSENNPAIWSNEIVWNDGTSGNQDIYYLDFVRPPGADIFVTQIDHPDPVLVNGYLTYTITVGDYGFNNATNVILTNTLSSKVDFYYADASQGTCTYANGMVVCNLGDIDFKNTATVNIVVVPNDTGYAGNSSSVSADQSDMITHNNTYNSKTKIISHTIEEVPFSRDISELSLDVDSYGSAHISCTSEGEFYPNNGYDIIYQTNKTGVWESHRIYNGVADNHSDLGNPPYDLWNGENSLIAVDGSNHEHICYVKHFTRTSVFGDPLDENYKLYYTNNASGTWQSPLELIELPHIRPVALDIDNNGKAHIAFLNAGVATVCSLYYFTNASGSWEYEILHNKVYDYASMVIDNNDLLHLSFYSMDIKDDDSHEQGLGYFNGVFGNWNTPEKIDIVGGQIEAMQTSIAIDNSNNPHISYLGGQYGNNKYAFKSSGVWTVIQIDTGWGSGCTSLDLDNSGNAHILYTPLYGSDIFRYAQNTSGVFEHSDIEEASKFKIRIDNQNKYHIVYNDKYITNRVHTTQYGGGTTESGGYYFANSTAGGSEFPSYPVYEWIDPVTQNHSEIVSWTSGDSDDGYFGMVSFGFSFPFFDKNYNDVYISSNGYLIFDNGNSENAEFAFIPSSLTPNNFIAACAMDLDCSNTGSHVYYANTGSEFIVTYWHVYDKGSASDYITFQIILYSTGNIKIQFNDEESTYPVPPSIDGDALVGIENYDGTQGLTYHNNGDGGPLFGSPLALMFGKDASTIPVELISFNASMINRNNVILNWNTASETNNYGFDIERTAVSQYSENSQTDKWTKIGFVKGHGTTYFPQQYSFVDKSLTGAGTYKFRLKQIDYSGSFKLSNEIEVKTGIPGQYFLSQNYPNPFNPTTKIELGLKEDGFVKLIVFNILGERVSELINKKMKAGYHMFEFNAHNLASGIYFYRLEVTNKFTTARKMIILK